MDKQIWIAITFVTFLLLFTTVGIYSSTHQRNTTTDYLLASRHVSPWLTALSAMATGQSGLLFIGQVGFAYKIGISSLWLIVGWVIGDYLAWLFVFKRLRQVSEDTQSETVSAFLSHDMQHPRPIAMLSALITIIFLGSYAAAQLVAGSKALNAVFGWNYNLGVVMGTVIVVIYCFSGGIRASIWTDALQAVIMGGSLLLLLGTAVIRGGGVATLWQSLAAIDASLTGILPLHLGAFFPSCWAGSWRGLAWWDSLTSWSGPWRST